MINFSELYRKLNPEQKEAVDTVEGPVMVVAGPGTGKTQILTLRVANILKVTDTNPDNILALTFTEAGAYTMRKRLVEIIGPLAYRINIYTFHSFSNSIIQSYPDRFPTIIGASNINIIDQIKILQKIIDETPLKKLKPFGNKYYYLRPVLQMIGKLKKDDISHKDFEKIIKGEDKDPEKLKELSLVYKKYQTELRDNFLYDYDDMIMEVNRVLENDKDLLLRLQEEYQYILADEHQDANLAQNKLLELIASYYESPNLFIVGDEKQAIFRFQGASLENFNYFKTRFKGTKLITLKNNYRSKQYVLDGASSLIPEDKLKSVSKEKGGQIILSEYNKVEHEAYGVKEKIEKLIKGGVLPGEIAVLYRDNKDVIPFIKAFEKSKIPFVVESDQDLLADVDIRKLILLIRTVWHIGNKSLLSEALHIDFLDIDSLEIYKFLNEKEKGGGIEKIEKKIASWHKTARNIDLVTFFEILVRESGFLEYLLKRDDSVEKMEKLDTLFDEIKVLVENHRHYNLGDFLGYVDLIEEHNILLKKDRKSGVMDSVRLMTAHRSKGQEFDHVFIVGVSDGHWGNRRSKNVFKLNMKGFESGDDDERRLFYVALTRARDGLYISYHKQGRDGQSLLPSRFVYEIDEKLIKTVKEGEVGDNLAIQTSLYSDIKSNKLKITDKKYLLKLIEDRPLSVTALNNYLDCPWKYFYNNLVRIPTALSKHQMYGIAVHSALKEFFESRKKTKKNLEELFEKALKREPVSEGDFLEMLEKGKNALSGYFDSYIVGRKGKSLTEVNIKGVAVGDINLTGKLDRVDILENGKVRVLDYKTSKPKTRNEILGKTKNSNGDIYRQLIFYKLLLNKYRDGMYKMEEGVIDFIEPNPKGLYKREVFTIENSEVINLEKLIKDTVKEIKSFSFWNKNCENKDCQFCKLRKIM